MFVFKILCLVKSLIYSLQVGWPINYWCSGHDFVEQEDGSLKCEVCNHISK